MNWKWRFALLMIAALPAFTGYPFRPMPAAIVPGLTWAWAGYGLGVHLLLMALVGRRGYAGALSVAALVTAPVVFFGGVISYALTGLTAGRLVPLPADSPHYLQLCLNMLTVIPLGLGIIMTVPFSRFEQSLIRRPTGVSALEKTALMALRVFNHIVFFVIPGILEVLREENVMAAIPGPMRFPALRAAGSGH